MSTNDEWTPEARRDYARGFVVNDLTEASVLVGTAVAALSEAWPEERPELTSALKAVTEHLQRALELAKA
jgi:hypothetical protein